MRGFPLCRIPNWAAKIGSNHESTQLMIQNRRLVYYSGCYVNYVTPETGDFLVHLLEVNGCTVEIPKLICCSIAVLKAGNMIFVTKRASKLVDILYSFVSRGYEVIYTCPTCGYALSEVFPRLLKSKKADEVAENTVLFSTYLSKRLTTGDFNLGIEDQTPLRIAYHVPCHLRCQGLETPTLRLLEHIPGIHISDIDRGCCGMGGTWALVSKKRCLISSKTGAPVFDRINAGNQDLVVTDCSGCQIQIIRNTFLDNGQVVHPIDLLSRVCRLA